ncbi:MAG: 50S ribosomal protein L11 methyltransferase [Sphingomonadales bacterium]
MTAAYTSICFSSITKDQAEVLIAWLNDEGYEGFEEREGMLIAFIASVQFDEKEISTIADQLGVSFLTNEILPTNWNAQWESNFLPVTIDSFLHIRAAFHCASNQTKHEIVITPKMSFGTGHHATTQLMVTEMAQLTFEQQDVFDFGTGTGVLAILAERLGARRVLAIDNDTWSIENAKENIETNHCRRIELNLSDTLPTEGQFSIILANINLSILVAHMPALARLLHATGTLLISGLLRSDQTVIEKVCALQGLRIESVRAQGDWILLRLAY